MPVMNFDLEDGQPPVSFSLKPQDCERMMRFMAECQAAKHRTWVGLTLDERLELAQDVDWAAGAYCEYAEKIEAKLKEKNQ